MRQLRLFILGFVLACLLVPIVMPTIASAASVQLIIITANPVPGGNECVTNFEITASQDGYIAIQLSWSAAVTGNGTLVIRKLGEYPGNPEDGTIIYQGNDTTAEDSVTPSSVLSGVYYHVYTILQPGNYSSCFAAGSITGTAVAPTSTGNITVDTTGISDMADIMRVGLVLGLPLLLGILGAWRQSLTGYLTGIIGLSLSIAYVYDEVGVYLGIPLVVICVGLALSAIKDAWGTGLRVF